VFQEWIDYSHSHTRVMQRSSALLCNAQRKLWTPSSSDELASKHRQFPCIYVCNYYM